jgi:hypothetical protein
VRLELANELAICPVCDWTAEGEPWAIATAAKEIRPKVSTGKGLPLLDLQGILDYEPDPKDEIWPGGILSAGDATALVGAPGVGKSRLALQAALCTVLGWPFLGWETRGVGLKWLFLQTENSTRRLKADLSAMTSHMTSENKAQVSASIRILNVSALEFGSVCMVDGHPDRARIVETLESWQPDICTIDPLRDAGLGDPNKDSDMTETCKGIGAVMRAGNPRRVPLVVHHGRTGAAEASRVFGDDAASFARNSKVLYGWLRSQINIAAAGTEWPETIILGCGKNSNGPRWDPFAAKLDSHSMTYRRLGPAEFDLQRWSEQMAGQKKQKGRLPSPEAVASVIVQAGGEVAGGKNAAEGLVSLVRKEYGVTRSDAQTAIEAAIGETIEMKEVVRTAHRGGGKPVRMYVINPNDGRKYEPKPKNN